MLVRKYRRCLPLPLICVLFLFWAGVLVGRISFWVAISSSFLSSFFSNVFRPQFWAPELPVRKCRCSLPFPLLSVLFLFWGRRFGWPYFILGRHLVAFWVTVGPSWVFGVFSSLFCLFLFGRPNWAARLRFWVTVVSPSILAAFSSLFRFSFWAPKMPVSVYNNICTCPGQHKRTPNIVRGKGVGALLYECEGFF